MKSHDNITIPFAANCFMKGVCCMSDAIFDYPYGNEKGAQQQMVGSLTLDCFAGKAERAADGLVSITPLPSVCLARSHFLIPLGNSLLKHRCLDLPPHPFNMTTTVDPHQGSHGTMKIEKV